MNPIYAQTGVDWVGVTVSRREVESRDVAPALQVLESLLYDAETVRAFRGRAGLAFHGYDDDPRELYQIPEVRRFVAELDSRFPYWFYFLSTGNDMLKMIAFCLCRTRPVSAGLASPDQQDLQAFLFAHFDALNRLFDRFRLDEAINEEISGLLADYFFPAKA
jgi:hypothetical protein